MMDTFTQALAERRRRPRDDIMTVLIEAQVPGEDGIERMHSSNVRGFSDLTLVYG